MQPVPFPAYLEKAAAIWRAGARRLAAILPKGLYARSLLIVILPMVLLQGAIAYVFMERHWQLTTSQLSAAVTRDIAGLIEFYNVMPGPKGEDEAQRIASEKLELDVAFLPLEPLPPVLPKPFFSLLDPLHKSLSTQLARQVGRPFWIDTVGRSSVIEIRIQLDNALMRVFARRSAAYASNSHIFFVWMAGTSLFLIAVAIAFLRNQIRPILKLAEAAENFGKGREVDYRPTGAREVRQAGHAFIEMKRRVARAIDQRTAMLNGVSHDLRTILTRFKLSLALMDEGPDAEAMNKDVLEMQSMLEAYLAFARGDLGEPSATIDMRALLEELQSDAERHGHSTAIRFEGESGVTVRPNAFKRCLSNLVANAQRHGDRIAIGALRDERYLTITVDDDGPGIPPDKREIVFRPFFRLDEARNQDEAGTGLGLAIARDIARSHGGDITLADSPLGGLRAAVRIPV
ncbi:MAG: HAMP domain-containing protein [Methylobacteriaceae bacterium]|nr:HAMP domain-containing protein [Methylobacteriaceae bacterium]